MVDPREEETTRLALLSLIPLALGALGVWLAPWIIPAGAAYDFSEVTLLYAGFYAAVLAGIAAGGVLMSGPRSGEALAPLAIAALVAWIAVWPVGSFGLALGDAPRFLLIIGVHAYLLLRDLRATADGTAPFWYGELRKRITFWICLALALILARYLI